MKILYDHQIFSLQEFGGISKYFAEIIRHLQLAEPSCQPLISLKFTNNYHIRENISHQTTKPWFPAMKFKGKFKTLQFLNRIHTICQMKRAYDLLHPTYYHPYFLKYLDQKPFVITIHDMIHEIYPENYPADDPTRGQKKQLAEKASKIIAISENTKNDVVRLLNVPPEKVEVVYHGCSLTGDVKNNSIELPKNYFLFVGQRQGYKNFNILLEAFRTIRQKYTDLYLVCVGGKAFTKEEQRNIIEYDLLGQVLQFQLSDGRLARAYQKAICLIYPSRYEGFGMPILEAFNNQCPVVLSNASCFPEIAADAAEYFDPNNVHSLISVLEKVFLDQKLRKNLRNRGRKRGNDFSWQKAARQTLRVYQSVL